MQIIVRMNSFEVYRHNSLQKILHLSVILQEPKYLNSSLIAYLVLQTKHFERFSAANYRLFQYQNHKMQTMSPK